MTSHEQLPHHGDIPPSTPCPLSDEAIALLPYSFMELDPEGTVLRVDASGAGPGAPAEDKIIGLRFFQDLLRPPASARVASRFRAMVRCESDNRFVAAVHFNLDGRIRCVQLVCSYYPSAGLACALLRDEPSGTVEPTNQQRGQVHGC